MPYNIFPEHNLQQTRAQLQLLRKLEEYNVLDQISRNITNASWQLTSKII